MQIPPHFQEHKDETIQPREPHTVNTSSLLRHVLMHLFFHFTYVLTWRISTNVQEQDTHAWPGASVPHHNNVVPASSLPKASRHHLWSCSKMSFSLRLSGSRGSSVSSFSQQRMPLPFNASQQGHQTQPSFNLQPRLSYPRRL